MSEKSDEEKFYPTKASFGDVYLLGLAIKLGGCVASWHNGFKIGFWPYFVCYLIVGSGYLALTLCVAEMISVISFPGGYYGYIRCGMGPLLGFLVGCSGLVESVFFLAVSVLKIGQVFTVAFDMDTSLQPIIWFVVYSIIILFHARGSRIFWQAMKLCTVFSLAIILLYLFGSMPVLNFNKYAEHRDRLEFHTSVTDFLHMLRLPGWFFMGIDMVSLTVEEVNHSKEVVPWSMVSVISTMIVLTFWLFMTVASQSPGVTTEMYELKSIFPLSFGFSRMLNIPESTASLFTLLPLLCSCTGYMFAVGRQLSSMARSGLFAPIFKRTVGADKVPLNAMLAGAISGLLGLFFAWQYDPYTMLFRLAMIGGSVVYVNLFVCFLIFKTRYSEMDRGCRNPCGYASSIYGIIIFSFVFIALARDTSNVFIITAYLSFMLLMWLYYYAYAEAHQFFSEKEQSVFLKAYIVNLNRRKKMAVAHKLAYDVVATYRFWERCAVWSRCSAMLCIRLVACCFCYHKNYDSKRTAVYVQTTVSTQSNSNGGSIDTSDKKMQGLEDGVGTDDFDRLGVEPVTENLEMAIVGREEAPPSSASSIDRSLTTHPTVNGLRNTPRAENGQEDPEDQLHPTFRFHWKPLPRVAEQPSSLSSSYVSQEMQSHSSHVSALLAMKQTQSSQSSLSSSPSKLLSLNRPGDMADESPSRFSLPPIHTGHAPLATNTSPPIRSIDLAKLSLDEETLSAQRQQRPLFRAYTPTSASTSTAGLLRARSPVHHPPSLAPNTSPSREHPQRDPDSFHTAMSHSTDISDFHPPLHSLLRRDVVQQAQDRANSTPPLDHGSSIAVEMPLTEDPSPSGPPTKESVSIPS